MLPARDQKKEENLFFLMAAKPQDTHRKRRAWKPQKKKTAREHAKHTAEPEHAKQRAEPEHAKDTADRKPRKKKKKPPARFEPGTPG